MKIVRAIPPKEIWEFSLRNFNLQAADCIVLFSSYRKWHFIATDFLGRHLVLQYMMDKMLSSNFDGLQLSKRWVCKFFVFVIRTSNRFTFVWFISY